MKRADRNTINNILCIRPYIYGLQDKLEDEQEELIADLAMPAARMVEKLIALDNRRVDLCNLKVLYAFIERELGDDFGTLKSVAASGGDSALFDRARSAIELAGYSVCRAAKDFEYLFAGLKHGGKKRALSAPVGVKFGQASV